MTDKEVMQMALIALEIYGAQAPQVEETLEALRAALAQPEPEPVAWMHTMDNTEGCEENEPWVVLMDSDENPFGVPGDDYSETYPVISQPLYTAPPQREWVGLTDEEILEEYRQSYGDDGNLTDVYFAKAIEAKLKEKNT